MTVMQKALVGDHNIERDMTLPGSRPEVIRGEFHLHALVRRYGCYLALK